MISSTNGAFQADVACSPAVVTAARIPAGVKELRVYARCTSREVATVKRMRFIVRGSERRDGDGWGDLINSHDGLKIVAVPRSLTRLGN